MLSSLIPTNPFTILLSKLWENIQGLFLLSIVVSIITCLLIQAIKNADDTIFLKKELNKNLIFIMNIIFNFIFSVSVVLVFDGLGKPYLTIIYMILIWVFSWSLSSLIYDYTLKYLFLVLDIIKYKLKNIKDKLNEDE
jgi:small basic protein